MTATPDELDRRALSACGWKARLLAKLAAEARAYRGDQVEVTTTYRRAA